MGKRVRLLLRYSGWEFVNNCERMLARPLAADCYSLWFPTVANSQNSLCARCWPWGKQSHADCLVVPKQRPSEKK